MIHDYSIKETAKLLRLSAAAVYQYEENGLLKRVEDPHRLQGGVRFPKEQVDQLIEKQRELDASGRSINELAKDLDVYAGKVKEAIEALDLTVPKVKTSINSSRMRYALTPEQEKAITAYITRHRTTRAKRNHLYVANLDAVLYQAFLIAGEQQVRLKKNEQNEIGFQLDNGDFIGYVQALKNLDIEPRYTIHQPKQKGQLGFTDLLVPPGKKAFYQILDVLYSLCGVENFNADFENGKLSISIRNGTYPLDYDLTNGTVETLREYITSGDVEVAEGFVHFSRANKTVQIQIDNLSYDVLNRAAKKMDLSLKEFLQNIISEKADDLKNN